MAKIFDYVLKYYSPIEPEGRLIVADDRFNFVRDWAYWNAENKVKDFLRFGDKVTIEPIMEDWMRKAYNISMNGYKVTAQGCEHIYRIEPRVRERKSQAWRGL